MTKKIFSLIFGEKNRISGNQKVIPASSIRQLLDAEEVLKKIGTDVERYKLEIAEECEQLKANAKKEGYAEGYQEWAKHIAELEEEIQKVRKELEKMLIPVALKAAKKILGKQIELSEHAIVDIVATALKNVSQHKKITIYVNKKDLEALEKQRNEIKNVFENLEVLSIRERSSITRGGCVIETEGGIINAELENQWVALERAFTNLIKNQQREPKPST